MAKIRVAINGMGRIGRTLTREIIRRKNELNIELVAVNNPGNTNDYIHLLKYDSLHGTAPWDISLNNSVMNIDGQDVQFYSLFEPSEIPWDNHQVDIVIDATGRFKEKSELLKHKKGSVKKVIMCAPGKNLDGTFVIGINHKDFDVNKHEVISNASCTTNCLSPIAKVLNDIFTIESGFMTTIHAYTSDQNLLDNSHSDLRRARAAAMNMIPTTTGAAKALGEVLPELSGKLDGYAVRVPVSNVSMVDLTVNVTKKPSIEMINNAMKEASLGSLKGVLGYTELPLVSGDFNGRTESSVFDAILTNVIGNTVKVVSWYDNETGFSNRVLDLANFVGSKL